MTAETDFRKFYAEIVRALVRLIEEKDAFIRGHSERVAGLAASFMKKLGRPRAEIDRIYLAGLLHDIGMVYVPLDIVQKSGPLTEDEMAAIRQHPVQAENILRHLSIVKLTLPAIRHHHEAHDGSGYPDGLKGNAIPAGARILSILDSYDAMMFARPHRPARSMDEVIEELLKYSGALYDPAMLAGFIDFVKLSPAPAPAAEPSAETAKEKAGNDVMKAAADIM